MFDHKEELDIEPGEGAWVPVRLDRDIKKAKGTSLCVQQLRRTGTQRDSLAVCPGLISEEDCKKGGMVFVANAGYMDASLSPGERIACVIQGGAQHRRCTTTGFQDSDMAFYEEVGGLQGLPETVHGRQPCLQVRKYHASKSNRRVRTVRAMREPAAEAA